MRWGRSRNCDVPAVVWIRGSRDIACFTCCSIHSEVRLMSHAITRVSGVAAREVVSRGTLYGARRSVSFRVSPALLHQTELPAPQTLRPLQVECQLSRMQTQLPYLFRGILHRRHCLEGPETMCEAPSAASVGARKRGTAQRRIVGAKRRTRLDVVQGSSSDKICVSRMETLERFLTSCSFFAGSCRHENWW